MTFPSPERRGRAPCRAASGQIWHARANRSIYNPASGECLSDPNWSTTIGTQLHIWTCDGGGEQEWSLP
jgi:hypothetical protein